MASTRRPAQTPTAPSRSSVPTSPFDFEVRNYGDLQRLRDVIYNEFLVSAQRASEQKNKVLAFQKYSDCHRLLEVGLRVYCKRLGDCNRGKRSQAKLMQQKMKKTNQEVVLRLQELQDDVAQEAGELQCQAIGDALPLSHDETVSEDEGPHHGMDEELMLHRDHNIIISAAEVSEDRMSHRTEIFRIHYGVEIIYISPEGVVSAPSCPSSLVIVSLTRADEGHTQRKGTASVFLQVGDWMYPLVAGSTPALRTVDGAYLFPDNNTKQPGSVVCLKLPERLAERKRSRFERLIESFTALELQRDHSRHNRQGHENPPQYGTCKLSEIKASSNSDNIVTGAEWIAWGIEKTAEKVGDLIRVGSEKLREQIPPESTECNVDPGMQKAMAVARKTAEGVADFTGFMVAALGEATMFVGRQLAPHVRRQGEKYLPEHMSRTDPWTGKSELDDLAEKTASGIKGFCTVYAALDSAARSMGRSLANETVQVMQHKYGAQVGQLTENAVYTAGSALQCVYNRKCLGAKAVAKRVARDTGKAVVEDINKSPQHTSSYCGSFYKL